MTKAVERLYCDFAYCLAQLPYGLKYKEGDTKLEVYKKSI